MSEQIYEEIIQDIESRRISQKGSKRRSLVKRVISQNRKRYQDQDFDLDLTLVSQKSFAMGFPGEGMKTFYRNSLNDVIKYFAKYHKGKVKIFNLCDDESIDTSKISIKLDKSLIKTYKLNNQKISISYFPMMDHNPAPLKMLFFFCLDALLYLL